MEAPGHRVQRGLVLEEAAQEFPQVAVQPSSLVILAGEMFSSVLGGLQRFSLCQAMEFGM